jgi:hypothetical protein
MKQNRIPDIRQVKIILLQSGTRPASVACCGGWAKWSHRSSLLALKLYVVSDARTTGCLLKHLSSREHNFNLEIKSRADVGQTKLLTNCRTEIIEYVFGPPRSPGADTISYFFKIRTDQLVSRDNREALGARISTTAGDHVKTLNRRHKSINGSLADGRPQPD